ncbi:MAG: futalosine hydrolase [Nitrospiraceae bacterium]|nr:futalosine hydrolase [Nitrospiraceae bacterium]
MIALLCSVNAEAEQLVRRLEDRNSTVLGEKQFMTGKIDGRPVVLCAGGMGKVNAAQAATAMAMRYSPDALIVFGVGGAYPASGARVGDIALASREIAGDEGVLTAQGFQDTSYIGIPLLALPAATIYNTYPAPEFLFNRTKGALVAVFGSRVHSGPFVTLSTCTGTKLRAQELELQYCGLCENMEGAAAAHVALSHGIPWLEVRGISNIVEDRDRSKWNIVEAALAAQEAVQTLVRSWA